MTPGSHLCQKLKLSQTIFKRYIRGLIKAYSGSSNNFQIFVAKLKLSGSIKQFSNGTIRGSVAMCFFVEILNLY